MNIEKIIRTTTTYTETGYLDDESGIFITHSFDDEPAIIFTNSGTKYWYKDGLLHRDNNLPAAIWSNGNYSFYKNGKEYWIINGEEYCNRTEVKEKFKNKILVLPNVNNNNNILKENGIDTICIDYCKYLILDQSQYNLAVLKFI